MVNFRQGAKSVGDNSLRCYVIILFNNKNDFAGV